MINRDFKYRFFEILPGSLVILIFSLLFIFSFIKPIGVIYFIIIYDVLWFFKLIYMQINLIISWIKLRNTIKVDWYNKIKTELDGKWQDVYHLILLPTLREPIEVVRESFEKLTKIAYDPKKIIVVLAGEGIEAEAFIERAKIIEKEYGSVFLKFIYTVHFLQEGEIQSKGSNCAYSGRVVKELLDNEFSNIPYENIIISNFDIDTVVHEQYFAHLTYLHLTLPNSSRISYQPLTLFNNNFWEAISINRLVSRGTTFWLLSDFMKIDKLFTFSSHSMNFKSLVDVGFWQVDVVSEDSRIGLQCLNYYNGDYKILPVYVPVSLDVVDSDSFVKSLINQYKQQRRWAYGMENFPYLMTQWLKNKKMPFIVKFRYIYSQIEGGITWATAPIILFIFGFLPLLIINYNFLGQAIIVRNAPYILETIMRIGMFGVLINAFISFLLCPKRKLKLKFYEYMLLFLEWLLIPIIIILLGAIPANEAYFRLMFGKYLGFWVTPKGRKI